MKKTNRFEKKRDEIDEANEILGIHVEKGVKVGVNLGRWNDNPQTFLCLNSDFVTRGEGAGIGGGG